MQHVGNTLKAMKSPEDLQREQQLGSMTTDLTIAQSLRETGLTQSQLATIHSKLLRATPAISSRREKIYGRKKSSDEFGEFIIDNAFIGEQDVFEVALLLEPNHTPRVIEAAHRRSPTDAYISHLNHLALHKIFGSSIQDKSILLHDYASALSQFPEFIVWLSCKFFWEKDQNKFFPKIAEVVNLCEKMLAEIPPLPSAQLTHTPKPPKPCAVREEDSDIGKSKREELIDFMKSKGNEDDYSNLSFYSNYSLEQIARCKFGWRRYAQEEQQ